MRRQFAATAAGFSRLLIISMIKPHAVFRRERVASGKSEGMRSQSLFDQQADYQLDVLGRCYRGATLRRDYQDAKRQTGPSKRNVAG
jgi:hypothetical protein